MHGVYQLWKTKQKSNPITVDNEDVKELPIQTHHSSFFVWVYNPTSIVMRNFYLLDNNEISILLLYDKNT